MIFSSIFTNFILCNSFIFRMHFINVLLWNFFSSFAFVSIYCVSAGTTILISISNGSDPYFFRREMEKTRSVKEEMDREVFISRQSRPFPFDK